MALSSSLSLSLSVSISNSISKSESSALYISSRHPIPFISTARSSSSNIFRRAYLTSGSAKISPVVVRAASSEDDSADVSSQVEELVTDLKAKWDGVEDKPTILAYGVGALLAFWLSAIVVSAVNSVPLLPKLMELFGLAYTGWFVYRYLIFEENRKELVSDIEDLKSKITGAGKEE